MAREFEKVRVTFKSICMNYNSHIGYLNAYFFKKKLLFGQIAISNKLSLCKKSAFKGSQIILILLNLFNF